MKALPKPDLSDSDLAVAADLAEHGAEGQSAFPKVDRARLEAMCRITGDESPLIFQSDQMRRFAAEMRKMTIKPKQPTR